MAGVENKVQICEYFIHSLSKSYRPLSKSSMKCDLSCEFTCPATLVLPSNFLFVNVSLSPFKRQTFDSPLLIPFHHLQHNCAGNRRQHNHVEYHTRGIAGEWSSQEEGQVSRPIQEIPMKTNKVYLGSTSQTLLQSWSARKKRSSLFIKMCLRPLRTSLPQC